MSKKILSAIAIAGLLFSLAACSSTSDAKACTPTKAGASSAKITVTGKVGAAPTVKFPHPLKATTTQRTVITEGTGKIAAAGTTVAVNYTVYNGTTGTKIAATTYKSGGTQDMALGKTLLPGLVKALECSPVGSRVAAVIPPSDAYGTTGASDGSIGATDTLVFVADVVSLRSVLAKANGTVQPAPAGFPTVVLAKSGEPTITIPAGVAAPTDLKIADLKKGSGTTVAKGDTVTVNYTGVIWGTGKVFDSSWGQTPLSITTTSVVPGFSAALVGQKVGSQVIAIIPPAEGYGTAGIPEAGISGTDTLVFVLDILGTHK